MALRKEQVVLALTVAVLGYLLYSSLDSSGRRSSSPKRADAPAFVHHPAPDPALALPHERDADPDHLRELFAPPSDTRPLPPLEFVVPPIVPLAALRPPPDPGPAPKLYGKFLRTEPTPFDAPDLFASESSAEGTGAEDDASASSNAPIPENKSAPELTPQEKAERQASYKKLYDWVRILDLKYGQIRNPDRYGLAKRPIEEILFVEFNPATGLPRLPGQSPIPFNRTTVTEFGFADTVANQIEVKRAEFGNPLSATEYDQALSFAKWCIEERLETPRALQVAEEMFRRAAAITTEDPAPHLGLALCFEAGFQFEKAFDEYRALLSGPYSRNPLVIVRLADLEARFRMFARAEERFAEGERYGHALWQVQWPFGRFLLDRGRATDALAHLRLANQNEPSGPETKHERASMRVDLGAALLATGELQEANEWFDKARQADPAEQRALAGQLSVAAVSGTKSSAKPDSSVATDKTATASEFNGVAFDLLLATGIESLAHRDAASAKRARQSLVLAASADPLRAYLPWRALSFLAETTGNPEEALRFIDQAFENDPTDAWTLYQRGRVLASRDDLDGALDSLTRALDQDLDFPDALAAMGDLAHRRGDHASAERYFERALMLDPKLTSAMALRGINMIELGDLRAAEAVLRGVLAIEPDQPTARNGLAWCHYRNGNSTEALARFRELDDNRRAQPETDPHRRYATAQIARITDHLEKVVWSDRFERRTLLNGWDTQEQGAGGPQITIHDGLVSLAGTFKQNGRVGMWQSKNAGAFVAFEARLTVKAGTTARVGLYVARVTARGSESQTEAEAAVARHNDPLKNTVQTRLMKRGEENLEYTDVAGFEWKLDGPIVLRIERSGDSSDTKVRILVDGFPVVDNKPMPTLGRTNSDLRLGVFAEGQTGRQVQLDIDDVEVVYRERK